MQELHYSDSPSAIDEVLSSEIAKADRRFCDAVAAGEIERAAREVYTADAVILPPGAPMVQGRDSIIRFWRDAASQLSLENVELSTVELVRVGEYVHQIGRAMLTAGGQQVEAKYTVLWKEEDGRWKWHVDCWNMNA